jgi:AcrR family transcriptional regulator
MVRPTPRKRAASERSAPTNGLRKRNLPADERRRVLLDAAMDLFSEKGLRITVQALADRVQVTQPLVHRYFPAKSDLIAAICDRLQNAHWDPGWQKILTDRSRPIEERIASFYGEYLPHIYRDTWYRGFWYAALNDPTFAQTFLARVTNELHVAIIGEVRFRFGYPSVDRIPPFERELELVWGMHSTMIFAGIRRYVYHTPVSDHVDTTVRDQLHAYLMVAPTVLAELMPAAEEPGRLSSLRAYRVATAASTCLGGEASFRASSGLLTP